MIKCVQVEIYKICDIWFIIRLFKKGAFIKKHKLIFIMILNPYYYAWTF